MSRVILRFSQDRTIELPEDEPVEIGANDARVVLEGLTPPQVDAVSDRVRAYLVKCKWQVPLELGETVEKITQDVKSKVN